MSGVDRISNLPDEIILCIFCFLPSSKLRAQTSVLSKRWRQLWTLLPSIQISVTAEGGAAEVAGANYLKAILGCIKSFNADELRRLSLDLWIPTSDPDGLYASATDAILGFAATQFVREICLRVPSHHSCDPDPPIPESLYESDLCLSYLTIYHGTFPGVPLDFDGFCYLKSIKFDHVKINNNTLGCLLDSCFCPVLERLHIIGCIGSPDHNYAPQWDLPKLTELTMHGCEDLIATYVEAPSLKSIKYKGDLQLLELTGSPGLLEAALCQEAGLDLDTQDDLMRLLLSVSTVEVLAANDWFYQFVIPKSATQNNLKELALCIKEELIDSVLETLLTNIGGFPMLETLDITFSYVPQDSLTDDSSVQLEEQMDAFRKYSEECHEKDWFDPLEWEPKCSFCNLKTVILRMFVGSKSEMRLVKFLLENVATLEKFVVLDFFDRAEEELKEKFSLIPIASSQVQMKLSVLENLKLYGLSKHYWMV